MKLIEKYNQISQEEFIKNITSEELSNLILELCSYWLIHDNRNASGLGATKIWYAYEYKIWKLGEDLRIILKQRKDLRKSNKLQNTIYDVIKNKDYKKGREPFVLLLGEFKFENSFLILKNSLLDSEIQGQAIISLNKLKMKGCENEIEQIKNSSKGWIRKEANKYLQKLSDNVPD